VSEEQHRDFRRRGLGRGLDALLTGSAARPRSEPAEEIDTQGLLISIDPHSVAPNPEQPRRDFDEQGLQALADSIRLHGLLHPIVVQRDGDGYRLFAGERRLRAAQMAGMTAIRAIVRPEAESGRQALEVALTENLQRHDLNPMEVASAYARLVDAFGLTHEAIGLRLGRSRPMVSNYIRLLNLPASVQKQVAEGRLVYGTARAVLSLPDPREQEELARQAEQYALSMPEVERAVQRRLDALKKEAHAQAKPRFEPPPPATPDDDALARGFEQIFGMPVQLVRKRRGGGRIVIDFAGDPDLDALYRRLGGPQL
jgi:ParB family transcriptional regulator, chromosome partitioning protein